jgi:hypothetical protein
MYIYNLLYCVVYYIAHEERIIYLVEYLTGRLSELEKQFCHLAPFLVSWWKHRGAERLRRL